MIILCCMQLTRILLMLPKSKSRLLLSNLTCGCLHWNRCATPPSICQASCCTPFPPTYRSQCWHHTRTDHTHIWKCTHISQKHPNKGREQHMTIKSTFRFYASSRGCIFKSFLRDINTNSTHFCLSCPPLLTHAHTFYKPPLFPYSTSTTRIIVLKCWANSQRDSIILFLWTLSQGQLR